MVTLSLINIWHRTAWNLWNLLYY